MAVGIELCSVAEPAVVADQDVVDLLVGEEGVAGLGHVRPGGAGRRGGGERQSFGPGAQHHRERHAAAGRGAEDCHLLRIVGLDDLLPHRHRVVHRGRIRKIRRHAVVDRDHFELAEARHQDRFARGGLLRAEHVAAAMHMNQHAIAVLFGNAVGRKDVAIDAGDRHLLGLDAEFFAQAGNVLMIASARALISVFHSAASLG